MDYHEYSPKMRDVCMHVRSVQGDPEKKYVILCLPAFLTFLTLHFAYNYVHVYVRLQLDGHIPTIYMEKKIKLYSKYID